MVSKKVNGLLEVTIEGNLVLNFVADCGLIQHIRAYLNKPVVL